MSMKDLLSKMTELQGTVESVEVAPVTATGKKVLNESSNTMKESTKPSLKSIFSSLLSEAEQVTIQPAKQNTQVIKQGQKTLGTVENPQLAQQIKQSIGKGEMSLAGDELQEDDMAEGLDPTQKQKLESLIDAYRDANDPDAYDYVDPDEIVDQIRQEFGDKIADTITQGGPIMHFPRPGHVYGYDRLAQKSPPRVTKLGKINRQDAETMKRNIKKQHSMTESKLTEKAVSKSQQQAAGAALAAKRGDAPKSKLKGASKEMAKMPAKELEKFAKTKHKGLPEKKKTDEAAMPTHDGDFGAGLGAGRNSKTLEAKAKPDFLDLDKDGNKKESMKKAAADKQKVSTMKKTNEAKAKPDFLDLDKDGNKKESMKKAAADKKKKTVSEGAGALSIARRTAREIIDMYGPAILKAIDNRGDEALIKLVESFFSKSVNPAFDNVIQLTIRELKRMIQTNNSAVKESSKTLKTDRKLVKEGSNPTEAAKLLGKAHALGKDPFACKYEAGTPEAQAYLDGYKEGLDECYGSGGDMGMQQDIGMMPGMDSMVSQDSMMDSPSPRGGSEFAFGGFDEVSDDDMMAFESWDRELNALLNEGKMKDIDIDMKQMSDAQFKKEHGKSKADMKKDLSSDTKKPVKEGISVSVSKGQQGSPDSVTVSAQDQDADALLAMIKQAGLGLFGGDEPSGYGSPVSAATQPIGDVGDHDSMMALIKKMSSTGNDYEDEESQDDQHAHGHPDAACGVCGSSDCGCDDESDSKALVVGEEQGYDDKEDESLGMRTGKESGKEQSMKDRRDDSYGKFGKRTDEDESEDQMEFEVAESNAPDSGEAETTADENAEAKEDQALAGAMSGDEEEIDEGSCSMNEEEELTEWANDAGYEGSENIKDNTFEQDIEFMTRIISGGLNGPKKDQTTLPHTRVKVDESRQAINDWKKLSGIK